MADNVPVYQNPQTPAHLRRVIDQLKNSIAGTDSSVSDAEADITALEASVTILEALAGDLEAAVWATMTASGAIAAGDIVYPSASNTASLAQADALSTSRGVGVALAAAADTEDVQVQSAGYVTIAGWSLTPGARYFLDPTTPGAITSTAPTAVGQTVVFIGTAVTATKLRLLIADAILL